MNKPERYVSAAEIATKLSEALHKYNEDKSAIRWLALKSLVRQAVSRLRTLAQEEK